MADVKDLIPHRDPFLFVDRLEKVTEEEIIGYRRWPADTFFFKGHFPEYPVVPGVILVESMAQCGGAGVNQLGLVQGSIFFLGTVDKVKLKKQVRPNDEVKMVITTLRAGGRMIKQSGKAYVGDELAASAEWMCLVGDA
ncbi:MAG: 3-hydroxyacyl-ACP dehydratase FabZ [Spirochaetales bacterium]|nr:3-hydroxyacyl-ACP dehydratase FabZ [Spirochaetales bacterium]